MKKKVYNTPQMEILEIELESVIAMSPKPGSTGYEDDWVVTSLMKN